jgi:hypothetical protein
MGVPVSSVSAVHIQDPPRGLREHPQGHGKGTFHLEEPAEDAAVPAETVPTPEVGEHVEEDGVGTRLNVTA